MVKRVFEILAVRMLAIFLLLTALLGACVPQAPEPVPAMAQTPAPTQAPTAQVAEPTSAPDPAQLILATTTSTADSGLLNFILPDFEQKYHAKVDVIAVGTGQSLEIGSRGDADVVLVHSRKGEDQFVADSNAKQRFDVMYNDFIIVGPAEDPARILGTELAKDAFKQIMEAGAVFVSRGDKSGTNTKELSIWASIPVTPTADAPWYNSIGQGMGDTLLFANETQGYTLTDRGTYLSMRDKLPGQEILVGGDNLAVNKDKALLNPYGVLPVNPEKHPNVSADLAMRFTEWLISVETQEAIGGFGVDKFGQPLFYPNSAPYQAAHAASAPAPASAGAPASAPADAPALRISGKVRTELAWSEADVIAMKTIDVESTNSKGETATYTGVPIRDLLALAFPAAGAQTIAFVADYGYTAEAPLAYLMACTDCIISFRDGGGFSSLLPGFAKNLQVKGVIEIVVK